MPNVLDGQTPSRILLAPFTYSYLILLHSVIWRDSNLSIYVGTSADDLDNFASYTLLSAALSILPSLGIFQSTNDFIFEIISQ